MMKEPEINVGIVNAQEIHFSLNGRFFAKGETVCGEQSVSFSEGGILWNGNLYRELTFTPQDERTSFSLYDVTIGINFHWERQETQSFMGTLKLSSFGAARGIRHAATRRRPTARKHNRSRWLQVLSPDLPTSPNWFDNGNHAICG